jgi:asparagine synthase (glutamine-hydrolysing)
MMYYDAVTYLPDDILVKVDRASMAVSLEVRAPLLDHRLVEFAWRLPAGCKIRGRQGKWILRQVLDRYVPRHLVDRPKQGFDLPIDAWLRGPLRDWADTMLDPTHLARDGFLRPEPIRAAWLEHLSGTRDRAWALWPVLMFQTWQERWLGAAGNEQFGRPPVIRQSPESVEPDALQA